MSKQFYGIKYPFSEESNSLTFILILMKEIMKRCKKYVITYIFTPKGQRIRQPEFGTNLIKFYF